MKKLFLTVLMIAAALSTNAQQHYWVMLTDKAGTTFDPYSYFDAKAIERYKLNNADLYDISNYPLNEGYVEQIDAIATEDFGQSRWFNAVAVIATQEQIEAIRQLPFVKEVLMIGGDMQTASVGETYTADDVIDNPDRNTLSNQIIRMGAKEFRDKGINGKGVRIAVFDGGFPQVNTHIAFKHLRDEGRIIKTWNFPNKKENVYGWNSHGLMTLSCIAGINMYQVSDEVYCSELGLATGAEFLLARTEVNSEPRKEEVWWQMAVEWADKNGAQIISSSLGYGKDRYYTKDMNGKSLVAKAGNMAARKGMLVCNSAGNEGSDQSWRTIITPSDADSVLCVGGITNSLYYYEHIYFSSYGPSADGRQKPNVVAFGHAYTANTGAGNDKFHYVDGTSFSCPLVAGFAACALQAKPGLTAMQLFHEIEKSGDLYPYCDYTYGYGVPQASYFVGTKPAQQPTFRFEKDTECDYVKVVPSVECDSHCYVFIKNSTPDGRILNYRQCEFHGLSKDRFIKIENGNIVTVNYNGYTESYDFHNGSSEIPMYCQVEVVNDSVDERYYDWTDGPQNDKDYIEETRSAMERYFMLGVPASLDNNELHSSFWSPAKRIGIRRTFYFAKAYGWGVGAEYGHTSYRFGNSDPNELESLLYVNDIVRDADKIYKRRLAVGEVSAEIYQRVRLLPAGILHKGLHWDLGAYVSLTHNKYRLKYSNDDDALAVKRDIRYRNVTPLDDHRVIYGLTTRITYDVFGCYARYRISGLGDEVQEGAILLPRLEVGLQLSF